jgi:N utilization substance protein B
VSSRTKARKRALDLLYGADLRGVAILDLLAEEETRAAAQPARAGSWPYAREIVVGVADHLPEIDAKIAEHADGWAIGRMPALDRALARLGAWEILYNADVPDAVAIAEAVEQASLLSTDASPGFLNGMLGAIARDRSGH